MKYYFITYQAQNRQGSKSVWNEVIDSSPMEFMIYVRNLEESHGNNYYNFVVLNALEISEEEYLKYMGQF